MEWPNSASQAAQPPALQSIRRLAKGLTRDRALHCSLHVAVLVPSLLQSDRSSEMLAHTCAASVATAITLAATEIGSIISRIDSGAKLDAAQLDPARTVVANEFR